jgi:hypothetical protein
MGSEKQGRYHVDLQLFDEVQAIAFEAKKAYAPRWRIEMLDIDAQQAPTE